MQNGNREVVIVEAVRTPVGRGHEEKGYYKDTHPSNLLSKTYSELIERAGVDADRGGGRDHRLRAAVRRAGLQHRPQRVARGGAADRDARHHDRPPVRLGPAGRELRRRPDGRRRAGLRHRLRRRAHGPHLVRRRVPGAVRARRGVLARAARALQPDPAGPVGRDDRRPVGDPPLGARRAGRPVPRAGPPGHRGGPVRARDRALPGQRRHLRRPTRASARAPTSRSSPRSSPPSRRTARSRPATRRRSPTAPPRCC